MTQHKPHDGLFDNTGRPLQRMPDAIRPGTNGVVFNERGEILLQKRSDNGFWALPGGAVDVGESVEQGVIREDFEETGLHVTVKRMVGIYSDPKLYVIASYPGGDVVHYVTMLFECERQSGELAISEESTDIGYFPPDRLPQNILLSHVLRIQDTLANQVLPFIR